MPSSTTDWGAVQADVVAMLRAGLTTTEATAVKSALSEQKADEFPKGLASVFVVSHGTRASDDDFGSGGGYFHANEEWDLDVLIYLASGKTGDIDRLAIQTLAAKVKFLTAGYTPATGQVDNNGFLRLRQDAPVEEYDRDASAGLKIRQSYVLQSVLISQLH